MWQEATGTSVVTGVSKGSGVVDLWYCGIVSQSNN